MLTSLTGHVIFACHVKVSGDFFNAGLLVLDASFVPGVHELWDAENNRYWVAVEGNPGSLSYEIDLRRCDAPL